MVFSLFTSLLVIPHELRSYCGSPPYMSFKPTDGTVALWWRQISLVALWWNFSFWQGKCHFKNGRWLLMHSFSKTVHMARKEMHDYPGHVSSDTPQWLWGNNSKPTSLISPWKLESVQNLAYQWHRMDYLPCHQVWLNNRSSCLIAGLISLTGLKVRCEHQVKLEGIQHIL